MTEGKPTRATVPCGRPRLCGRTRISTQEDENLLLTRTALPKINQKVEDPTWSQPRIWVKHLEIKELKGLPVLYRPCLIGQVTGKSHPGAENAWEDEIDDASYHF